MLIFKTSVTGKDIILTTELARVTDKFSHGFVHLTKWN